MRNFFDENRAREFENKHKDIPGDLALRIYTSRLIGKDTDLVLHGGGNTSVKIKVKNIFGEDQDILFVKGSGWDLSTIESEGFTGLDLNFLQRFQELDVLTDEEMESRLLVLKTDARAPDPSVEALLHGFLPHKYVDHTHADTILALTNQKNGETLVKEALGDRVGILPYVMSGLPLAKGVLKLYRDDPDIEAIVIMNHGIFTFGDDAKTSYSRMIDCVDRAESFVKSRMGTDKDDTTGHGRGSASGVNVATMARLAQTIRGTCAHRDTGGKYIRFYTEMRSGPDIINASLSDQAREICRTSAIVPDHVIRTKNKYVYIEDIPEKDDDLKNIITQSVDDYKNEYEDYFKSQIKTRDIKPGMQDSYPRVFLVKGIGLVALGLTPKAAMVAADIAEHTICVKLCVNTVGEYVSIPDTHIFDMEYWTLQQKKMNAAPPPPLQGQVAVVTGAGGAIGFGIADRLMAAGAVVVISDIDESRLQKVEAILSDRFHESQVEREAFDVTDLSSVEAGFARISKKLGGIDILVPNAGIAHVAKIQDLSPDKFRQVTEVNLMGTFNVIKASIPVFKNQGTGGNIVLVSSKNVFDPGAAFGAYSASKAGAHQISKIAALELAELGVRVNMVNPDAVFGDKDISSKLWDLIGPDRMKSRGLDPDGLKEYYKNRNLLKVSVLAEHVGNAVVFFSSDLIPTTGATLPVDGGVPAAFPR